MPADLRRPVLVAAFAGWNDAGESATAAVDSIARAYSADEIAALDPEDYYDFQVNRPSVSIDENGLRLIEWPTTRILTATGPGAHDLVLVQGIEPSMRWRAYCAELIELAQSLHVETVVTLGALLADVTHTRPVQVTGISSDQALARRLDLSASRYEGPTGIVGVLQDAVHRAGLPAVSFWAAVPTYVPQIACPKATVALLRRLDELIDAEVPLGDLPERAAAWERGVDELAAEDSDVAEYVAQLERVQQEPELPEGSGENIARAFERYLRHQDEGGSARD